MGSIGNTNNTAVQQGAGPANITEITYGGKTSTYNPQTGQFGEFKEYNPIPKSQVEIDDSAYRTFNGRPSGVGNWAFEMGEDTVFYSGKYSSAKQQAIAEAARRGVRRVKVGL